MFSVPHRAVFYVERVFANVVLFVTLGENNFNIIIHRQITWVIYFEYYQYNTIQYTGSLDIFHVNLYIVKRRRRLSTTLTCPGPSQGRRMTIAQTVLNPKPPPPPPPPPRAKSGRSVSPSQFPVTRATPASSRGTRPWGWGGWRTSRSRSVRRWSTSSRRRLRRGGRR